MGQLEGFRASLKRKDSAESSEGEIPVKSIAKARDVDADRFAVDLLMNEEFPDYKVVLAIVLFPVSYTLRVLVRQFQCQVCIDHDLATYLTDCRTDPFE